MDGLISIHALLAESDVRMSTLRSAIWNFYPRSPCGERPSSNSSWQVIEIFLSTLSLRRATRGYGSGALCKDISIHALLAESDFPPARTRFIIAGISIHALLAESDVCPAGCRQDSGDFYPRSPCGERRGKADHLVAVLVFLSTLSLRRATSAKGGVAGIATISIHALLAESDAEHGHTKRRWAISIHALLAESDIRNSPALLGNSQFLSTLSLRRATY